MKLRALSLYFILILIMFGAILPFKANAASSTSIFAEIAPENPAPYEDTSIFLSSYSDNLDNALISWSENGKRVLSGIGKKSFSLKAPAAGAQTTVIAQVSLPSGAVDVKVIVKPLEMVLLWQANDSYLPPFYKGKAMPTPDSEVKVVAMPEVKSGSSFISSKNMTYAWEKDYTNDQEASGYGRNFFLYMNDYLDSSNSISVTAETVDQKYSSQLNMNIATAQPKILFYKSDDKLGTLFEQTLQDGHKIEGSETVVAVPYFISPKDVRHPDLVFSWFINDAQVAVTNYRKNVMPLKVEPGVSGQSKLRLDIESKSKIFESTSKEMTVEF